MSYRLIKGDFHLFYQGATRHVGSQPDGDSMWFHPDDPTLLEDLDGRSADFNGGGFANLRFEGIDALEIHYKGAHQSLDDAKDSRDFTLNRAGFTRVDFSTSSELGLSVVDAQPHPIPGYILTRNIDPFGRPVAFVFAGSTSRADGGDVFLDVPMLNQSINAQLMQAGMAYPAYYTGLPWDLRERLTQLADSAYEHDRGVWTIDVSQVATAISGIPALEALATWPKLFRRLLTYFKDGNAGVGSFETWLRADSDRDDALWIIPEARTGNMHDVLSIKSGKIQMRYWPEELIIVPR